nr:LPXTG cell wall anchor domain-containing protein [Jiangella mangrovi]
MDTLAPGDTEEWTFRVQLDSDAPAGELGVAAGKYDAHAEDYAFETVVTVAGAGDDDGSGDHDGSGGDGEELPDTGTSSTTVTLLALGLVLAGGAAMTLRARRA